MIEIKCAPGCGGPIAKGFEELLSIPIPVSFSFKTRCSGCKKDVTVLIETKTAVVVSLDGEQQSAKDKKLSTPTVRTL